MMTLSIGKTIAPALLLGTAGVAAIVYAVTQIPQHPRDSAAVGVMSQPSRPGPAAAQPAPTQPAPAAADTSKPNGEAKGETKSEPPPALASAQGKLAALSADLGPPPPTATGDPSLPAFDVARVEAGGDAVIAGRAAPGATVELMRNGERLDQAVADASGQFVMVPPHLPAGSYELTLSAKLPDGTVALSKQGVTVTVKEADTSTGSLPVRPEAAPPVATADAKPQQAAAPGQATAVASATDEGTSAPRSGAASNATRIVARGDSLWRISRITYGAGEQYAILYRANRNHIRDPNLIHPGQVLVLPVKRH